MEREVKTYVLKRPADEAVPRTLSIDYAASLNPQQLAAVTAGDGPALVIAGAGSGKTRTNTYRVGWLLEHRVAPQQHVRHGMEGTAAHPLASRTDQVARTLQHFLRRLAREGQ